MYVTFHHKNISIFFEVLFVAEVSRNDVCALYPFNKNQRTVAPIRTKIRVFGANHSDGSGKLTCSDQKKG